MEQDFHRQSAKTEDQGIGFKDAEIFYTLKIYNFMALKVKAVERLLKFDKESAGKYRYVMKPEM